MRILVSGVHGQIGYELARSMLPLGEVVGLSRSGMDLSDADRIREVVRTVAPDLVVNAGAYTAVDKAESEAGRKEALAINVRALEVLAEETRRLGIPVVHYSSDYVYDGRGSAPFRESDPTAPLGVYGMTKRDGDLALMAGNPRHLILRVSWVVGAHGQNFARTMLRLGRERDRLAVVADQVGVPTPAPFIADLTAQLAARMQRQDPDGFAYGLYNAVPAGETSWFEYARFVLQEARSSGVDLRVQPEDIEPLATADYPTAAARPLNSRLDTTRLRAVFGVHLPDWRIPLSQVLRWLW